MILYKQCWNQMEMAITQIYLMKVQLLSFDGSNLQESNDYSQFVFAVDQCKEKLVDIGYDWQLFTFKATLSINVFCVFTLHYYLNSRDF